jgi:pilus assembly protein CpaE
MAVDEIIMHTEEKSKGDMIIFLSGKGGVGKTVTAVNLGVALVNKGLSTCILDGNFQFGDVSLALDIQPIYTISNIIQEAETLEQLKISYYLDKHKSGLNVLSAPTKPEQGDLITQTHITAICNKLLEQHDVLIVDLPPGLSENNLTFMEMAQKIFLVSDSSFPAVKNTKVMLRAISMLNMNQKVKVVVILSDARSIIDLKNMNSVLEVKDISIIANNSKLVSESFSMGIPFIIMKPKEKVSKDINAIANELYNERQSM